MSEYWQHVLSFCHGARVLQTDTKNYRCKTTLCEQQREKNRTKNPTSWMVFAIDVAFSWTLTKDRLYIMLFAAAMYIDNDVTDVTRAECLQDTHMSFWVGLHDVVVLVRYASQTMKPEIDCFRNWKRQAYNLQRHQRNVRCQPDALLQWLSKSVATSSAYQKFICLRHYLTEFIFSRT